MHTLLYNGSKMMKNISNASDMIRSSTEIAWKVHWITFAFLFFITACFSMALLFKAVRRAPEFTRSYRESVFAMVMILCVSRTIYLLLNPYEVEQALVDNTPVLVLRLLYALGQPSLTAGFGLIHASFLKVAKARLYHQEPLLKTRSILIIVGLYFTFGVITEVITASLSGMQAMLAVSAFVAIVGCVIVTGTITYSGLRILRKATENQKVLRKSSSADCHAASKEQLAKAKSIAKVSRVTLAASTFCIGLSITNSIAFVKLVGNTMFSVTRWNSDGQFITFVTCVRLLEIAMALTLIYALCRTNMKLRKILGFYRFTRKLRMSDGLKSQKAAHEYTSESSWKSASSFSSEKHFIE